MKTRAPLLTAFLAATLAATLTACGDDSDSTSVAAARTTACRAYLVGGGAGDTEFAASVDKVMTGIDDGSGSGYSAEPMKKVLAEIRLAAADAGRTKSLSNKNFIVFEQVAAAAAELDRAIEPDSDREGLNRPDVTALTVAVEGVHHLCD